MKKLIIILIAVYLGFAGFAEDRPPVNDDVLPGKEPDRTREDRKPRDRDRHNDLRRNDKSDHQGSGFRLGGKMMEKLKEENPEEFERLSKLRKDDPEKFRIEIGKLMRKRMEKMSAEWFETLKEENPEKYERLTKLREEDPSQFRLEVMKEMGRRLHVRPGHPERLKKYSQIKRLTAEYKKGSDEEKKVIKAQMQKILMELSLEELEYQEKRIEKMEDYLLKIRKRINERRSNMEVEVERKLEKILNGNPENDHKAPEHEVERP